MAHRVHLHFITGVIAAAATEASQPRGRRDSLSFQKVTYTILNPFARPYFALPNH